ncbi:hypothetical protein SAY86_018239 [Trapa natans]|uniref:Succinate dehydrogenase subunit 3 n=1 Tax=Trapa natans TaxID=22666 RepID=A0AAN7R1I0_TRANT|nr:hypothetical protein SAY86_018239 [Trapa natans]
MASLLQKNRSAAQQLKALSGHLRNYGARCGELNPTESLSKLQKEMTNAGNLQAMQSPFRSSLFANVKKEAGQIRALHQARLFSSVAVEQIQTNPTDSKKNILRPLSPHLPIYKPQLSSTLSITHRVTGAFMSAAVLSFHLLYLKMGPVCFSFSEFYQFLFYSSKLGTVTLELCALALAYHVVHGTRHLIWDFKGITGKWLKKKLF